MAPRFQFGICKCGKWGTAPRQFRENYHFMVCPACGESMYLSTSNPEEAAYRPEERVEITQVRRHSEAW